MKAQETKLEMMKTLTVTAALASGVSLTVGAVLVILIALFQ